MNSYEQFENISNLTGAPIPVQEVAQISNLPDDLKSKADLCVEKMVAFSEFAKKNSHVFEKKESIKNVMKDLEFSESTVKTALKFADGDGVGGGLIGNWTISSLNMFIQEVGSSVNQNTVLNAIFPDKPVASYNVILDRIQGNNGIAGEFGGDNSVLPVVDPLYTYEKSYKPALFASKTWISAKQMMYFRKRGESVFDDRGLGQLVSYNMVNLTIQQLTRKKQLLADAVFNNGFAYAGGTINSNIPSGNYFTVAPMGTLLPNGLCDYSTLDPYYNPFRQLGSIINNPIFRKYLPYVKGVVVNSMDLINMTNHPNVQAIMNAMNTTIAAIKEVKTLQINNVAVELATYLLPGFEFPIFSDADAWVQTDGTQNFFIPQGQFFVVLDLSAMGASTLGAFHLTYNEVDPNATSPAQGLFAGVFARNLNTSDTTNRLDIVASLSGGPAIYMSEAIFVGNGLYSNV